MDNSSTQHEHTLQYHCHKGVTGEYIGQFTDIPGVLVHSTSKEGIKEELLKALDAYLNAFPEEHDKIFAKAQDIEKSIVDDIIVKH